MPARYDRLLDNEGEAKEAVSRFVTLLQLARRACREKRAAKAAEKAVTIGEVEDE